MLFYKGLQLQEHRPCKSMLFSFNIYKESCDVAKSIKGKIIQWNLFQSFKNLRIAFRVVLLQAQIVKRLTLKKYFAFIHVKKIIPILRLMNWYKDKEEKTDTDINENMDRIAARIAADHPGLTPYRVLSEFTIEQITEFQKEKLRLQIQNITIKLLIACSPQSKKASKIINDMLQKMRGSLDKFPTNYLKENVTKPKEQQQKRSTLSGIVPRVRIC